ncbi:hypothetical protein H311_02033 [Anncaliia algerae PRA109]|nr:hypothetical protein H311_02033 [Anncaliia algerae PRA109]
MIKEDISYGIKNTIPFMENEMKFENLENFFNQNNILDFLQQMKFVSIIFDKNINCTTHINNFLMIFFQILKFFINISRKTTELIKKYNSENEFNQKEKNEIL